MDELILNVMNLLIFQFIVTFIIIMWVPLISSQGCLSGEFSSF